MYNGVLKKRFIDSVAVGVKIVEKELEAAFNEIEKLEEKCNTDISLMTVDELRPVIEQVAGFGARSRWKRVGVYEDYIKWCTKNNIPGVTNSILCVKEEILSKIRMRTVSGPHDLLKYLDEIFDPADSESTHIIYRCFYWMAFAGMSEEDILETEYYDVDLYDLQISRGNDTYTFEVEGLPEMTSAAQRTYFNYQHPKYDKMVIRSRSLGRELLRGFRGVPGLMSFRAKIGKFSKEGFENGLTQKQLSYNRVWLSGLFYRVYQEEKKTLVADFSKFVDSKTKDKVFKVDSGRNTQEAIRRKIANYYLNDYLRWKEAHGLV